MDQELSFTDIGLATAIAAKGFILKEIRPLNNRQSAFVFFGDKNTLQQLETDYWADRLTVPARKFHQEMKAIKHRLYGQG